MFLDIDSYDIVLYWIVFYVIIINKLYLIIVYDYVGILLWSIIMMEKIYDLYLYLLYLVNIDLESNWYEFMFVWFIWDEGLTCVPYDIPISLFYYYFDWYNNNYKTYHISNILKLKQQVNPSS